MLKADFHVHTALSKHHLLSKFGLADGLNSPDEMVKSAADKGLDCIAIAEHNVLFDSKLAKRLTEEYGVVVIPGVEFRFDNRKEAIAIGIKRLPEVSSLAEFKEDVSRQGGILIAPHPYDPLNRGFKDFELFDAIEVVNAFGPRGFKKLVKEAESLDKAKVCGSDAHYTSHLGYTHCLVDAAPDQQSILEAIRKGRVEPVYGRIPIHVQLGYYIQKYLLGKAVFKSNHKIFK